MAELAVLGARPRFEKKLPTGVPFVEEKTKTRFHEMVDEAFNNHYITNNGPLVERLEAEVAERHHVGNAVVVANATLAQMLLLKAMGLEKGDVLMSANTFIATAHACEWQGLRAVFCDIDPETLNLDPMEIEKKATPATVAVIPTHIFGVFSDMPVIQAICRRNRLLLLADAAHAFDCDRDGVRAGGFGVPEFISFHATKFFSTIEGGAIVTGDDALAKELRIMRNFGFDLPFLSRRVGTNAKLSEIHAAFGLASLPFLEERRERLLEVRERYIDALEGIPGITVYDADSRGRNNYRYFALRITEDFRVPRDALAAVLKRENVLTRSYFAPGCHRMPCFADRGQEPVPNAEAELDRIICLPTSFEGISPATAVGGIVDLIRIAHGSAGKVVTWWEGERK